METNAKSCVHFRSNTKTSEKRELIINQDYRLIEKNELESPNVPHRTNNPQQ